MCALLKSTEYFAPLADRPGTFDMLLHNNNDI